MLRRACVCVYASACMRLRAQSSDASHVAQAVLQVEAVYHELGQVRREWAAQLRDTWRRSLAREGVTIKDVALHLASLQHFLALQRNTMTRTAFMRHVSHMRCPLFFPTLGEVVMLLRTGCVMHLDKYAQVGKKGGGRKGGGCHADRVCRCCVRRKRVCQRRGGTGTCTPWGYSASALLWCLGASNQGK